MLKSPKYGRDITLTGLTLCLVYPIVAASPVGHTSTDIESSGQKTRVRDLDVFIPSSPNRPADSSFLILQQRARENFNNPGLEGGIKVRPTEYDYDLVRTKGAQNENSNVFIFCLMFLFGLIMSGLVWCLCAAGRSLGRERDRQDGSSRRSSRFSRMSFGRPGANIHVIFPDTTDLPPAYNEIFSEYDKLGAQCILPSYKEIMSQKNLNLDTKDHPSSTPTSTITAIPSTSST